MGQPREGVLAGAGVAGLAGPLLTRLGPAPRLGGDHLSGSTPPAHGSQPQGVLWAAQEPAVRPGGREASPAVASWGQAPLGPQDVGLWAFEARRDENLTFRAGDLFHVAGKEEEWRATPLDAEGRPLTEGYVPHNDLAEKETVESEL